MAILDKCTVAILLTNGFEQVEMTSPREALEGAGATTHLVSPQKDQLRAWDHTDWGERFDVDVPLAEARPEDYDALLLPGGVLNPDKLRVNDQAVAFVKAFFDTDKPVASICHGPWTLVEAGVVEGRRMTSYASIRTDLKNAGAHWVDEETALDGKLLTSRSPDDLPAFNETMVALFAQTRQPSAAPARQ